jgi:hypothetical protein
MKRSTREAVLDVYISILGAMLLLSPWVMALARGPAREDVWVSGAIIVMLSAEAILLFTEWEEWIVLACGAWLVASPWLALSTPPGCELTSGSASS